MPPELTDRIVDFLHDDQATLQCCSLTCRSWLATVRYHLYYAISLENIRLSRAFASLLNRAPSLGRYVREMNLAMSEELQRSDVLPSIVIHLGHVRRLALSGDIFKVDKEIFERFGPVQELALALSSCKISDVAALFLAFPGISDLSIKNTRYLYGPADHVPMLPVKRLELQPALNPGLLPPSSPMLESLVLSIRRVEDLVTLSHILRTAIRQLKQLDLQMNIPVAGEKRAVVLCVSAYSFGQSTRRPRYFWTACDDAHNRSPLSASIRSPCSVLQVSWSTSIRLTSRKSPWMSLSAACTGSSLCLEP